MMIAVTGSSPNVIGHRIALVAAGPSPGSTPTSMPTTTPIRQNRRLVGSSTTPKPSTTGVRSTGEAPLEHVRDRDREQPDEDDVEHDHRGEARDDRRPPGLAAEEPQPHEHEQRRRDLETDHPHDRDEADHGGEAGEHVQARAGEPLRVAGPPGERQQPEPEADERD